MNQVPYQSSEASADIINAYASQYRTYARQGPSRLVRAMKVIGPVAVLVFPPLTIIALIIVHR
tara:strand:- start:141 stop:329 length:189 start_codon:yes stop_codon:yes gene_type:complete